MEASAIIPSPSTLVFPLCWHLYLVSRWIPSLPLHLAPTSFLGTLTFHFIWHSHLSPTRCTLALSPSLLHVIAPQSSGSNIRVRISNHHHRFGLMEMNATRSFTRRQNSVASITEAVGRTGGPGQQRQAINSSNNKVRGSPEL